MIHHKLLHRETLQVVQVSDAELPHYSPADWVIDVDLAAVANVPAKYWVLTGDTVSIGTPEYCAQADAAELAAAIKAKNDLLWTEADAVNAKYIQGGALVLANELFKVDNPVGIAVTHWVRGLWEDYYERKAQLYACTTLAEVDAISADFTGREPMPHSVGEIMYWSQALGLI